jgi:hypothetical protein
MNKIAEQADVPRFYISYFAGSIALDVLLETAVVMFMEAPTDRTFSQRVDLQSFRLLDLEAGLRGGRPLRDGGVSLWSDLADMFIGPGRIPIDDVHAGVVIRPPGVASANKCVQDHGRELCFLDNWVFTNYFLHILLLPDSSEVRRAMMKRDRALTAINYALVLQFRFG